MRISRWFRLEAACWDGFFSCTIRLGDHERSRAGDRDVSITALTVIGDGAKFHMHTAYVGFGAPIHQIEARPLLDAENPTWIAGQARRASAGGPWQADSMRMIRGVAMAPDGKLWVRKGTVIRSASAFGIRRAGGKLVHEFFGPRSAALPAARSIRSIRT